MRRALCVGIDKYKVGPLSGCVSDANRMATLLSRHEDGTPNFDCKVLVAPMDGGAALITGARLKKAIEQLFRHKAAVVLLYFSGHGTENNLGGYLVTQDAKHYDEGVSTADVLLLANESRADEVVIILDCCHAGHLGQIPAISNDKAILREGVSILTASRGDQYSVEVDGGGLFTSLVAHALTGGAANLTGEVTTPAIYAFVEAALGAWDQRPLFKAHVSKMVALRKCRPAIDTAVLRDLPVLFSEPTKDFRLSPEYEESSKSRDPAKTPIFLKLQALSCLALVAPVGARHMSEAAMRSKCCRLTTTGRYYWRLAKSNRI